MLETLNSDIKDRIWKEVYKQTKDLRAQDSNPVVEVNILERAVERREFYAELDKKASKHIIQDCLDSLNLLYS